ncbi:MAG: ribosome biogenesis GTPase Der [Planctomycetota bacterium]|nr:ribosome biogenesis GTPase Der [Planctomycetota bacterium]
MGLPIVAIVGRPNVGKSSLLNCMVGRLISIVDPTPGVTRDRVSSPLALGEGDDARYVELVDTGGMGIEDHDNLTAQVEAQIDFGLRSAALILFVVDARDGLMPLERHVAARLRKQDKPVILVANKIDTPNLSTEIGELNALGFGEPMSVSAVAELGITALLERVEKLMRGVAGQAPPEAAMKIAVVGKRNAGKSTFINALAGEQRVIVSETPGTTRDSVDVNLELDGRSVTVIDPAGLRKHQKQNSDSIEFYSRHRALRSIRRADVVLMMMDASVSLSQVDKELAGVIAEEFKPVVLVVNKWDLAAGAATAEDYLDYLAKMLPQIAYAPMSLTKAKEGVNVHETVDLAWQLLGQSRTRLGTGELNTVMHQILTERGPSHKGGTKVPKVLYVSQVATEPPTIVCFVNDVRSFDYRYERYLINRLRETTPFAEVPIRLLFRGRRRADGSYHFPGKGHAPDRDGE